MGGGKGGAGPPLFLDQNEPLSTFRAGDQYGENRHGNNHDNHRDIVHVITVVDDDDDGDGDDDGDDDDDDDDDTEAMK